MSETPKAVFLSYASQDAGAALRLCEALTSAGIEVWFDRAELRGGDVWDHKIRHQIRECALFIPIISAYTQSRPEGYFRLEWHLADRRTHLMGRSRAFLVPVCVDDTPEIDADVPDSFSAVQWTRLPHGNTSTAFIQRISHLLAPEPALAPVGARSTTAAPPHAAAAPKPRAPRPARSPRAQRILLLIGAAVMVIGLGYVALDESALSKRTVDAAPAPAIASLPIEPTPRAIPEKSIAVLPFVNMSGDPRNDYFSDGITEEILDALAQVPNLKVAARTSAFAFKGKAEDLRKVGEVLDVATVLEGSVQKSGDEVRITAQLIDTRSGYHLWSEKYDRKLTSIFAVEDEISKAISDKLQVQWIGGSGQRLVAQKAVDPRAHDFYLRGLTLLAARSVSGAVNAFREAVAVDPAYAQAWAALAEAQALLLAYAPVPEGATNAQSLAASRHALALNPNVDLAYVAQGIVYSNQMRWADADRALQRALALAPGDAEALDQYAQFLYAAGQIKPALAEVERALRRDPLSGVSGAIRAQLLLVLHRDDAALRQIQSTLAAHPDGILGHRIAAWVYLSLHRYSDAELQIRMASPRHQDAMALLVRGIADPHMRIGAVHALETSSALAGLRRDAIVHALFLTALGEHERALAVLEELAINGDSVTPQLLWYPAFDPIRNDPRFEAVLKKMGLPYLPKKAAVPVR